MEVFDMLFTVKSKTIKQEIKRVRKQKDIRKKIYHKVDATLKWCDVKQVSDEGILLGKNGENVLVKGIKIEPKNIFILDVDKQKEFINGFRLALNKIKFQFFISIVKMNNNFNVEESIIINQLKQEKNKRKQKMFEDDLDKLQSFKNDYKQIEFHIYVRDANLKVLEKKITEIYLEFKNAGFIPTKLKEIDYKNYINYVFENPMINDFYFSRGIFEWDRFNEKLFLEEGKELQRYDVNEMDYDLLTTGHDENLSLRSKLVPTAFAELSNYLIIGDKYVSNILITQLPIIFTLGLFAQYVSINYIKLFISVDNLNFDLQPAIKKEYNMKLVEYNKTTDPKVKADLERDLISIDNYLKRSTSNNDSTLNTTIVFGVYGESLEDLKEKKQQLIKNLKSDGYSIASGLLMQEALFRVANPILLNKHLPSEIRSGIGIPLQAESLAGLHPFIFDKLKDENGLLLGKELVSNGCIIFNPFYYLDDQELSKLFNRVSGNIVVVGTTGSGKSTLMNLIIRYFIRRGVRIFWEDPENKNERLTRIYGGDFIEYGKRGNIINVFDLQPITFDDVSGTDKLTEQEIEEMYDTSLAIDNAIERINVILDHLFKEFGDEDAALMGKMIRLAYHHVGIKPDPLTGKYTNFKDLGYKDYPTFSTLKEVMEAYVIYLLKEYPEAKKLEIECLNKLAVKLESVVNQWAVYLNGHTTIMQNENGIMSFGTKVLYELSPGLRKALKHIINTFAWGMCVRTQQLTALIRDEAHTDMADEKAASELSNIARRSRKYNTVSILGTQEPKDFANPKVITDGKAIFNNSVYKFIMHLEKDAILELSQLINLNENEKRLIKGFKQGDAIFVCGNRNMTIHVTPTAIELNEF